MPQRFLKPGLISTPKWDSLSWIAQSFYVRLLTLVDDFGRYEANPLLLRSMAFPLREDIRALQVTTLCNNLADNQLAVFYKAYGKEYLQLTNWTEKPRSDVSRYPAFDDSCELMFANVINPPRIENKCSPSSSSSSSIVNSHTSASKVFQKPTAEEVSEYAQSIDFSLDGAYFIDYYETRGWKIKNSSIKDWKACVRTWKKNKSNPPSGNKPPSKGFVP